MDKFFDLVKKYWYIIIALVLVYPFLVSFLRRQNAKNSVRASEDEKIQLQIINGNPTTQMEALNEITSNKQYQSEAKDIFHHLGLAYAWYDPRRWTENDEDVFNILKKYKPVPTALIECYYLVSSGGSLQADCQALLDSKYYKQLKW